MVRGSSAVLVFVVPAQSSFFFVLITIVLAASVGSVVLVMYLMQHFSGWSRLARAFPARPPAPDARGGLSSIGFYSWCNYNNCILWKSDAEHLHLSILPPFSWMYHPPMSIPWVAVEIIDAKGRWPKVRVMDTPIRLPRGMIERELQLRAELEEHAASA